MSRFVILESCLRRFLGRRETDLGLRNYLRMTAWKDRAEREGFSSLLVIPCFFVEGQATSVRQESPELSIHTSSITPRGPSRSG